MLKTLSIHLSNCPYSQDELYEIIGNDFEILLNNAKHRGQLQERTTSTIKEFIEKQDGITKSAIKNIVKSMVYTKSLSKGIENAGTIYTSFMHLLSKNEAGIEKSEKGYVQYNYLKYALPNHLLKLATEERKHFMGLTGKDLGKEVVREITKQIPRLTKRSKNMYLYNSHNLSEAENRKITVMQKTLGMLRKQGYTVNFTDENDCKAFFRYHNARNTKGEIPSKFAELLNADNEDKPYGFKSLEKLNTLDEKVVSQNYSHGLTAPSICKTASEQQKYSMIFARPLLEDVEFEIDDYEIEQEMDDLFDVSKIVLDFEALDTVDNDYEIDSIVIGNAGENENITEDVETDFKVDYPESEDPWWLEL